MTIKSLLLGLALAACAGAASAATVTVSVDSLSGPWDQALNPSRYYGAPPPDGPDNSGPTSLAVAAGDNLTITWLEGLTSAFGGEPIVDANGYVDDDFGSGVGRTGEGFFGRFPSYYIDPTNMGSPINLAELIGAFADSTGVVIGTPFAVGDGPFSITAPAGATRLLLGLNDDGFSDNTGALSIRVDGLSAAPEPGTWVLMIAGVGLVGLTLRRRRVEARSLAA